MKQTPSSQRVRLTQLRDAAVAVGLIVLGVLVVVYYQIKAANTEPVSITSNTGGAASQMLSQSGNDDEVAASELETPLDWWAAGSHSDTYVVDVDGTNSTCARCHDPLNYIPTMDDLPASCNVCKFKIDPPPPFIAETEAQHVDCKICHRVDSSGTVLAGVSWLEVPAIEQYADVASINRLCENCHTGSNLDDHADISVAGVHAEMECTQCHNEHSMTASCVDCHDTLEDVPGHDDAHASVSCVACHDAGDMAVGPDDTGGDWITFADPDGNRIPWISHALQREVACDRCHYDSNPWELSVQ